MTRTVQELMDQADVVGTSAEVHRDGKVWWGTAGVERSPVDRFRIGSTTKTFVAVVVLQLVDLDATVDGDVTLEHLLHHTSGIFDYLQDLETLGRYETFTPELLIRIARAPCSAAGCSARPNSGALFGSYTYAYGTRTGDHLLVTNVTSDWGDPIGLFTEMLTAEFG